MIELVERKTMTVALAEHTEILQVGVEYSEVSLKLDDALSFDEWQAVGKQLKRIEGAIQWWIGDWVNFGDRHYGEKYSQAIDETGYDYNTLQAQSWVSSRFETLRRRNVLSWSHHREVASLDPKAADVLLDQAESQELSVRELRMEVQRQRYHLTSPDVPSGKYRVIYADPPWQYGNTMPEYFTEQADHYPLMSIEDICAMPVSEMAEPSAVLFLWVTSPILEEAFEVIRAWGFEYKASFVWDKIKHNMGHYNSVRHEFLLVCVRGSCMPDEAKLFDSVQNIERTEHSRKPEEFREIIETIYPHGKRIELFARSTHDGWDAWGNQVT